MKVFFLALALVLTTAVGAVSSDNVYAMGVKIDPNGMP